jgi:hypothetical protein
MLVALVGDDSDLPVCRSPADAEQLAPLKKSDVS